MNCREKSERQKRIARLTADRDFYAHTCAHAVFMGDDPKARDYADAYERTVQQLHDMAEGEPR